MTSDSRGPSLPDVTLVAVTSVAKVPTIDALRASMRQAEFARVILLSDEPPPPRSANDIEWRRIGRLASRSDYSRFMLRELADHVETSHALCIQWDGYVLKGEAWDPAFLDYDYIGALWPHFTDGHNVGNGGFSLRSHRLLCAGKQLPFDGSQAEDVVIGRLCRDQLERDGIRFAPEAIARRFAFERTIPTGHEFGFHGAYNLVRYRSPEEALELFRSLEPQLLASSEIRELLFWALRRSQWKLALNMLKRLIRTNS